MFSSAGTPTTSTTSALAQASPEAREAGIAIGVIAVGGGGAGTGFDEDFHAGDGQALQCRRHERDASFAAGYFVGHEKFHGCP